MSALLPQRAERYLFDRARRLRAGGILDSLMFCALRTLGPLHARVQHIAGRIHHLRGDHAQAERWLLAALAAGGHGSASTYNFLVRSQVLLSKFGEAERNLQAAIHLSPRNDGYYLHMADLLRQQGRHAE